jgi:hypothetical protein
MIYYKKYRENTRRILRTFEKNRCDFSQSLSNHPDKWSGAAGLQVTEAGFGKTEGFEG